MSKSTSYSEANETEFFSNTNLLQEIRRIIHFLASKWKAIVVITVIGATLGVVSAINTRVDYTGTLTFALEDEKNTGGVSGALGLVSQLGFDLGSGAGGAFSGSNIMELMKSRNLIEKTLLSPVVLSGRTITLANYYINFMKLNTKLALNARSLSKNREWFIPGDDRSKYTLEQDSILGVLYQDILKNNLVVSQKEKKVSILSIDVISENEKFSKLFAETLARVASDFYIDTRSKKAKLNVAILERQTDSIKKELNNAISGVAVANDNNYNLNPALNIKRVSSVRRQIDVQANTAILTELVKNLELARVNLRKETPLIQIVDLPILPLKNDKPSKFSYMILGAFLGGFISILVFIIFFGWKKIKNNLNKIETSVM